jgi:hypothetical protein
LIGAVGDGRICRSGACAVLVFIINVPHSHRIATLDPSRSRAVLRCVRGVHFHHKRAPLLHRIATLYPPRSIALLRCVWGAHFQLPWLSLAAPGCPLAAPGLLLAAPGCSWLLLAAPGCPWLLMAAPGCSWLPLAAPGCLWLLLMSAVDPNLTTCLGSYAGIISFSRVPAESPCWAFPTFNVYSVHATCMYRIYVTVSI